MCACIYIHKFAKPNLARRCVMFYVCTTVDMNHTQIQFTGICFTFYMYTYAKVSTAVTHIDQPDAKVDLGVVSII